MDLRTVLRELITEQSAGEWSETTIELDVEIFAKKLEQLCSESAVLRRAANWAEDMSKAMPSMKPSDIIHGLRLQADRNETGGRTVF